MKKYVTWKKHIHAFVAVRYNSRSVMRNLLSGSRQIEVRPNNDEKKHRFLYKFHYMFWQLV